MTFRAIVLQGILLVLPKSPAAGRRKNFFGGGLGKIQISDFVFFGFWKNLLRKFYGSFRDFGILKNHTYILF